MKILLYPCSLINNSCGEYIKAGDDCVRYVFSVLNYANCNFIDRLTSIYGYNWKNIDSRKISMDCGMFAYAMQQCNFEVYDSRKIKKSVLTKNGIEIKNIDENFILEKGDIIARKGHVHIFLGDDIKNAENFGWGKVNNEFPAHYDFEVQKNENGNFVVALKKPNGVVDKYTRVYRYRGDDKTYGDE